MIRVKVKYSHPVLRSPISIFHLFDQYKPGTKFKVSEITEKEIGIGVREGQIWEVVNHVGRASLWRNGHTVTFLFTSHAKVQVIE